MPSRYRRRDGGGLVAVAWVSSGVAFVPMSTLATAWAVAVPFASSVAWLASVRRRREGGAGTAMIAGGLSAGAGGGIRIGESDRMLTLESDDPLSEAKGSTCRNHVSPPSVENRAVRGLFGGGGGGPCDDDASGCGTSLGSNGSSVARDGMRRCGGCAVGPPAACPGGRVAMWASMVCWRIAAECRSSPG